MIWTTTGNLTNLQANAKFDFGLAPYPGKVAPASVLGGGNLYIFKKAPAAEKEAALKFVKFLTSDEILADWSINTGYVAPRDGAWNTAALKAYAVKVPEILVARDQIPVSVPEWSTHENARTGKVLNDALAGTYGDDAIRYSLLVVALCTMMAGLCFLAASFCRTRTA